MKKVVFVCVHNSGRSQMAEAFAKRLGAGKIIAESAGTQPADGLNPEVVQAMKEIGYDMKGHYPKLLTIEMINSADRIITMGCGVDAEGVCPASIVQTEDWGLEDPKGRSVEQIRQIRDQIKTRVEKLIQEMTIGETQHGGSS